MGWFRESFANRSPAETSDENLIRSFVKDANAVALSTLVERHLPMVFRVCRSILGRDHDAEDATQATFLVLTQRAATIRNQNSLASWLHGVALSSARAVQRREQRERKRVESVSPPLAKGDVLDDLTLREAREILHAELEALPERDKLPILLVHFEDNSHEEAAKKLNLSLAAFRGRLERARERLGARLARHRLSLTATLSLVLLTVKVPPAMASTVTGALVANSHPASVTATAALVPASAESSSVATGLSLLAAGTAALFIAVPLFWPSAEPRGVSVATTYPIGHILIARGDHVAVLNPDDGRAVPVSPNLVTGRFASLRVRTDGGALAYQRDDGTLHSWRFDEPFPGIQAARQPDAYAWLADGRLAVFEAGSVSFIRITTGERETLPLPNELRVIDIHPNGESLFVIAKDDKPAIFVQKTQALQSLNITSSTDDFRTWRFSPSGTMLGGIVHSETLTIVETANRTVRSMPCPDAGRFFAWSPDGKLALVGRRSVPANLMLVPVESPGLPRGLELDPRFRNLAAILQNGGADWCR